LTLKTVATFAKGLVAMLTSAGGFFCFHFDPTGNMVAMTDPNEAVVLARAYTPFGIRAGLQGSEPQPFDYPNQHGVMTDPNGLQYMRARYYSPHVGRFLSEDPIGFDGGDVNLYVYARNNPVLLIDPWGLCSFQQGLKDTAKYAGYFAVISFLTPGGQTAAIVFTGIAIGATGLEVGLYSENKVIDTAKEVVKQVLPVKKPYDMLTDQAIDKGVDMIKSYSNSADTSSSSPGR